MKIHSNQSNKLIINHRNNTTLVDTFQIRKNSSGRLNRVIIYSCAQINHERFMHRVKRSKRRMS